MNIVLCGYKASGKTTIGQACAKQFHCNFIDTDDLIIAAFKVSKSLSYLISEIYQEIGEENFRQLESDSISNITQITNTIIATGGGAVMNPNSVRHLKSLGKLIYLYVSPKILCARLLANKQVPSFINPENKEHDLRDYLNSRNTLYQNIADHTIDTDDKTIEEIVSLIDQYRSSSTSA